MLLDNYIILAPKEILKAWSPFFLWRALGIDQLVTSVIQINVIQEWSGLNVSGKDLEGIH